MIKIEADTLEELYEKATKELECSVTDLDIDIIQKPSNFLGLFKKKAIAIIGIKEPGNKNTRYASKEKITDENINKEKEKIDKTDGNSPEAKREKYADKKDIQDPSSSANDILEEIYYGLQKIVDKIPLDISIIDVKMIDKHTVYIKLDGDDASLIIGKHAYRYKALSYLLYSWIHGKYGLLIKLEISEFIKRQESYVLKYLDTVIEKVKEDGTATTKSFDGILMHVAVNHLRETFPDKNVMILKNRVGDRYIKIHHDR